MSGFMSWATETNEMGKGSAAAWPDEETPCPKPDAWRAYAVEKVLAVNVLQPLNHLLQEKGRGRA